MHLYTTDENVTLTTFEEGDLSLSIKIPRPTPDDPESPLQGLYATAVVATKA